MSTPRPSASTGNAARRGRWTTSVRSRHSLLPDSRTGGRRPPVAHSARCAEENAGIEVDLAPDEAEVDVGFRAGGDDLVEGRAGAFGIVTRTMSGWVRANTRGPARASSRAPDAVDAAAAKPGLSSTKPTTRSPAVSRSSRIRLRPVLPAPTMTVRRPVRSRTVREPIDDRPLGEPRAADRDDADERVDDEEESWKSACPASRP